MKLTYPICCGVDVHKTFLVVTIITSEYVICRISRFIINLLWAVHRLWGQWMGL